MELQLEASHETGADERYLLEQYLALMNDELQALPIPVHEWFLERWALAGPGTDNPERINQLAERIAEMYFMAGPGTHQAVVVAALLASLRSGAGAPRFACSPDLGFGNQKRPGRNSRCNAGAIDRSAA
jgi:hypothetical protein